jgi:Ca-activated chloride channel family protein
MPELAFHFLRPWWLLALLPAALFLWLVLRREREGRRWEHAIAPHLLKHLLVGGGDSRAFRPAYLVTAVLAFAIVGAAGPTWRREPPPFTQDRAPLVIALDVSQSMAGTDLKPSRLERAKQKVRDLLAARGGARTGLVAYAGTAHLVMPSTDDPAVIEPFLAALATGLMPVEGRNAAAALALARQMLAKEAVPGTVLLVADGLSPDDHAAFPGSSDVVLLLMTAGDSGEATAGIDVPTVRATVDQSDIRAVERRIANNFQAAQAQDPAARWRDDGYWLVFPAALLALLWFRRGWTVQWALALFVLTAAPARAEGFADIWLTPDQQGRIAFDRGDYRAAQNLFADPYWQGVAAYRSLDYLTAAQAFAKVDTRDGWFALGNAQAHNHAWEKSIAAYEHVLRLDPDDAAAKANLAIVRAAFEEQEKKRRQEEQKEQSGDLGADEVKIDPKQKGGKRTEVQPEDVTTPGAAEAWMRQVQTSPGDFLKVKFAQQAASPPRTEPAR